MLQLPIENYPETLQEYGRAIAWMNLVESYLNLILLSKGGMKNAKKEIVDQILDEMFIGKKIALLTGFLSKDLVRKLYEINNYRVLLAHGVTSETMMLKENGGIETGKIVISHKQKTSRLDSDTLGNVTGLARQLAEQLHEVVLMKPVSPESGVVT